MNFSFVDMSFVERMHIYAEKKSCFWTHFLVAPNDKHSVRLLDMICSSRHIKSVIYIIWMPINRITLKKRKCILNIPLISTTCINLKLWTVCIFSLLFCNDAGFEEVILNVIITIRQTTQLINKKFFNIFLSTQYLWFWTSFLLLWPCIMTKRNFYQIQYIYFQFALWIIVTLSIYFAQAIKHIVNNENKWLDIMQKNQCQF